jgi:hypothetical protein
MAVRRTDWAAGSPHGMGAFESAEGDSASWAMVGYDNVGWRVGKVWGDDRRVH